jgi:anti-sigma regulatory factor (Ser/Thr protein kinase)
MLAKDIVATRFRCALPFEAAPAEIPLLRRVASGLLGEWGLRASADEVELLVTELATNVIKHVGEGSSAVLIMEWTRDRLRVEVHDRSWTLPQVRDVGCEEECGRGLHLLAAVAAEWGAALTAVGKVVWCEVPVATVPGRTRVSRAVEILERYRASERFDGVRELTKDAVMQEAAVELIADLLHWVAAQGSDPDEVLDQAQRHYEAEAA